MPTLDAIQADFDQSLDQWREALRHYRDDDLRAELEPDGWTLGQVYEHLINSTQRYHAKQIELCLGHHDHQDQGKTPVGEALFAANAFPDRRIHVPPSPQYTPEQPAGRAVLTAQLEELGMIIGLISQQLRQSQGSGKTPHATLGYLNATEWLQLIAMHWRHHLRQKQRLDGLLVAQGYQR